MLPACRSQDSNFEALMGQKVNSGTMRNIYEVNGYPNLIIKEDTTSSNGANETEAVLYFTAVAKNYQKVLECVAEVKSISQSGKYLIMERLISNIPNNLMAGAKIPREVSDNKLENFGVDVLNKVKCLDYALLKDGKKPEAISGDVSPVNLPMDQDIDAMKQIAESLNNLLREIE